MISVIYDFFLCPEKSVRCQKTGCSSHENKKNTQKGDKVESIGKVLEICYLIASVGNHKSFNNKTKCHNTDTGSNPGQKSSFISHMNSAVFDPGLPLFLGKQFFK